MIGGSSSGELKDLSNKIDEELKEKLDRAAAGCQYNKRTILSAMIDHGLEKKDGLIEIDENLEEVLEEYGEHYSQD